MRCDVPVYLCMITLHTVQGKVDDGRDVSGALCIKRPWPGIARTVYGDHERYLDTYFRPYPGTVMSSKGMTICEILHFLL